jgi:hypothetical protein
MHSLQRGNALIHLPFQKAEDCCSDGSLFVHAENSPCYGFFYQIFTGFVPDTA